MIWLLEAQPLIFSAPALKLGGEKIQVLEILAFGVILRTITFTFV
jgi:hypothetical protein